ncbi:MAG: hypothetical protein WC455_19960 [Dehalococcoidia bacterium]|jgi:hypothetical protein
MVKIDFRRQFVSLPGDPEDHSKEDPINKILAYTLSQVENSKDPVKLWGWALELANNGVLNLDKSDVEFLKKTVLGSPMLKAAGTAQILEIIDMAKNEVLEILEGKKEGGKHE